MKNPLPQGNYRPALRWNNIIYTAGMTPRKDGVLVAAGKFTAAEDLEVYREAVIQAASNVIAAIENCLEEGEQVSQILSLYVFVNAAPSFTLHPKVGDIVSDILCRRYGEAGKGVRVAAGMASLPGDAPVEVQAIAAVGPGPE